MDATQFDTLTRALRANHSRRVALITALAGSPGMRERAETVAKTGTGTATTRKGGRPSPPFPPFCRQRNAGRNCHATGPRCVCALTAAGAPVCAAVRNTHGEPDCGFCGVSEICLSRP
jgi:hypothetical protein